MLGVHIGSAGVFFLCLLGYGSCAPSCVPVSDSIVLVNFDVSEFPPCDLYYVQLASPGNELQPFGLVTTHTFPVNVTGLNPDITYSVSVRGHNASTPSISWGPSWFSASDWIQCSPGQTENNIQKLPKPSAIVPISKNEIDSQFLQVYRISEYSFDVDFLANHDGASIGAMPLYLMTCSPDGTCSPWSVNDTTTRWNSCQEALQQLCPDSRGASFDCLNCMDLNKDAVTDACGDWSMQDTTQGEGSYSVHWYCGVGWPESTPAEGPITEYCVEYLPLTSSSSSSPSSSSSDDGFSDYLSCNSDEVDAFGNDPRNPSCICICYDDRLLSHQSPQELQRDCSFLTNDDYMPWVNETSCNCANTSSPLPQANNLSSLSNIGRTPIYLPYVGVPMLPTGLREYDELIGYNYHFPKDTECKGEEELGDNGCTWKRKSISRMIYGQDLLNHGWDLNFIPDTPTNMTHTKANIDAFATTFQVLGDIFLPSPCGGV